jgi:2-desacetyl-2-hydroxyethyl bacteriochlorophyllide A dehydrogenase
MVMYQILVKSPKKMEVCQASMPEIKDSQDVLIKVKMAGICGSDVHIYHGTSPVATYPRIIGHEIAGEVVKVGNRVNDFKPGDHVVMDPVIGCGSCYPCLVGRPNVCVNLKVRGVHVDGGYQEYMVLPRTGIHKISPNLSWEKSVMVEPFTVAAQVVARGEVNPGDTVFIMGAGPAGLTILQAVKKIGARCIISDLVESRLDLARRMGADVTINVKFCDVASRLKEETDGFGPNVIIDAVCNTRSFEDAVKLVATAGRIVLLGFAAQPSAIAQLDITARELDIKGSRLHSRKFPQVIQWFEEDDSFNPTILVSHRFHFTEIEKAIFQIEQNPVETTKIILEFD